MISTHIKDFFTDEDTQHLMGILFPELAKHMDKKDNKKNWPEKATNNSHKLGEFIEKDKIIVVYSETDTNDKVFEYKAIYLDGSMYPATEYDFEGIKRLVNNDSNVVRLEKLKDHGAINEFFWGYDVQTTVIWTRADEEARVKKVNDQISELEKQIKELRAQL